MAEEKAVFDFKAYKVYLEARLGGRRERRGLRSQLARTLGCQPTYISQVLNGTADFSLEQADRIGNFLGHGSEEQHFFLLLIQRDRAGTSGLRQYFERQLNEELERRMVLTERLGKRTTLSKEDQGVYYSSWIFSAVHIALTIPSLQTREALCQYLGVPAIRIGEVLEFLVGCGLADIREGRYETSEKNVRVGRDSHNVLKHHSNWRTQALKSLDKEKLTDLHYSSVFSISKEDILKIKDLLLNAIQENAKLVQASREEDLCALAIDFFALGDLV